MTGAQADLKALPFEAVRAQRFPLNVYTYLARELFDSAMLHFGLFESAAEPLASAQQRSNALVDRLLRPAPARVVEVGIGFGLTLARLLAHGYTVTGITPEPVQHAFAARLAPGGRLLLGTFEALAADVGAADAVLFQESAQYIAAGDLWTQCARVLGAGGQVLVLDEFRTGLAGAQAGWLPLLPDFIAAANRHGFTLRVHEDLGTKARPTVTLIADTVRRERARIERDLELPAEQIDSLLDGLARLAHDYRGGQVTYALLDFRR